MSSLPDKYIGARQCFENALGISRDAIEDDQEEEVESYDSAVEIDEQLAHEDLDSLETDMEHFDPPITPRFQKLSVDAEGLGDDPSEGGALTIPMKRKSDHETMFSALKAASKNVVGNSTLQLYIRLWILFTTFCLAQGFIQNEHELEKMQPNFPSELPTWIALWIMNK
ncbi:hypothetical protein GSI_07895 [Ganoderma sinense ZZ0214-1]|uniref:Uncharacterized protein n=1 Tax=Ganoderma sinense ZZ0214-1 TaxID=1077348 RepID=A0A2G8S8B8_9APHY|nr:hypothetical protein GSI_07895 [Ganoderma sinense ZZ0214-1]